MNDWRHTLQINLMHDAIARWDDIDVFECGLGPINKVKSVVVAAIFNEAVLRESIFFITRVLNRQRMIDDQLSRHDRIDF